MAMDIVEVAVRLQLFKDATHNHKARSHYKHKFTPIALISNRT